MMLPRQEGLGSKKMISTSSFYSLCLKTAGHPEGLWHKQEAFRYGKLSSWWSVPVLRSTLKAWHRVCRSCKAGWFPVGGG